MRNFGTAGELTKVLGELDGFFNDIFNESRSNYPVTDIYFKQDGENKVICVEVAMAGIPKECVSLSVDKARNILSIENNYHEDVSEQERQYVKKTIAKRKFSQKFSIPRGYKLDSSKNSYEQNILHIELVPMDESENPVEKFSL